MRYIYDGNDGRELLRKLIYSSHIEVFPVTKLDGQSLQVMEKFCCLDDMKGAKRGVIENVLEGTRNG